VRQAWVNITPDPVPTRDMTQSRETLCRHALEAWDRNIQVVQDLEVKLNLTERWEPGCPKWLSTAKLVSLWWYQCCLDSLEGLVVARMFELTKMNMSQTGE
jgi:hypothetical protein